MLLKLHLAVRKVCVASFLSAMPKVLLCFSAIAASVGGRGLCSYFRLNSGKGEKAG